MGQISLDLRQRVFDAKQAGESVGAVAVRFAVSEGFVRNLLKLHATTGSLEPRPRHGGRPRVIDEQGDAALLELLAERNDLILRELKALLEERYGIRAGLTTVHTALERLGVTRKKRRSTQESRTA